jgi:hypothetical protein
VRDLVQVKSTQIQHSDHRTFLAEGGHLVEGLSSNPLWRDLPGWPEVGTASGRG